MKIQTAIDRAWKAHSNAESRKADLLLAVLLKVGYKDADFTFLNSLSCLYQSGDGFCLADNDGNNYSVDSIAALISEHGNITVDQLKSCSI